MHRRWMLVAVLGVATLALQACSDDAGQARSVLSFASLNGQGEVAYQPLYSDLVNYGQDKVPSSDDYIVEDAVQFRIRNDPADARLSLSPGGPFGKVTLTGYKVVFHSPERLASYEGDLHLDVVTGSESEGVIIVVPAEMKMREPLASYLHAGSELLATAEITVFGVEQDSNAKVSASASLTVHFANWAD